MKLLWHKEAQSETTEAAGFYQEKQSGLEQRFLDILEEALQRILRRPKLYPLMGMLKKAASGVLAILPYSRTKSTLRASKWLRPCWTDFFEHSLPLT